MARTVQSRFVALLALGLAGCEGSIGPAGEDPTGTASSPDCKAINPGDAPIRRMTRVEYNNTVRDLLGDTTRPADAFSPDQVTMGFDNQASSLVTSQLLTEQYMKAAETLSENATSDLAGLIPGCDAAVAGPAVCAARFIADFGKRAFRRPLTPGERSSFETLFQSGLDRYDYTAGLQLVIQAMLQSPHFLYRVEFGAPDPVSKGVVELDAYEVASRLSYLIWNSMPDEELFAAAGAGRLRTAKQIEAQARRMLADDKARDAVANFHRQWLELSQLDSLAKDPATYPAFTPAIRELWKEETYAFVAHVIFEGEGDLGTLLTAPYSMMNAELAAFYGVKPPSGAAFARVDLDGRERAGFLTHASVLAVNAKSNQSSPVHRGKFVRERLLCQTLPPPPADVEAVAPDPKPGQTTRERFAQHRKDPACSGCHDLMDPIGFGFEHFDGIGQWRERDQGLAVDDAGEILGGTDVDGAFHGAVELAEKLAKSEQVRTCVATQWFRFGYGRAEQKEDLCTMDKIQKSFQAARYDISELLVALTQTDAFRYRKVAP
jgi:hypothetical protein